MILAWACFSATFATDLRVPALLSDNAPRSPDPIRVAWHVWTDEQVKKELYRQISDTIGRSEKAVEYKVQNVAYFDSRPREEKPVSEAPHAQALLREVFEWYWADRQRARSLFPDYFQQFQFGMASPPHAGSAPTKKYLSTLVIEEGAPGFPASARRKRSRTLLEQGRSHFREADPDGKLRCAVCSFVTPEGVEAEIVQLHHTEPLYGLGKQGTSMGLSEAISKLIPLCPTCHQIAHVEKPPLTVGSIKKLRDS
jgi:hypothetical protein